MARISKGILGGFSGKVGTVVGAVWRGQDIIRSIPKPSSRPASDKQLQQQMKFKLVITFLQPLKSIQQMYFGTATGTKSRINLAVAYTIGEAVQILNDEAVLVFSKVLITKGDLAGFQNGLATAEAAQKVKFTWEDNSAQGNAAAKDVANAVVFVPESGLFEIYENIGERRPHGNGYVTQLLRRTRCGSLRLLQERGRNPGLQLLLPRHGHRALITNLHPQKGWRFFL